ncbi:MAG: type II CRISPR-associated endonuclease Cas1 [Bacteroidales bacterium]|nr:type II CRISPR-associated endonuclease Cas1 [Bacteroidales bacterium]
MIKRTLLFGNPAYLSLRDQQLVADITGNEKKQMTAPVEDIGVVLLDSYQITITHQLLNSLLANNTAVITCNEKHMPYGLLLPLEGNTLQSERFKDQMEASVPLKKQLWQQTVQAKIANQRWLLQARGIDVEPMRYFEANVRSGDPDNYEGRAAAYYWKNLFDGLTDDAFIRGRYEEEPNNLLNYGYAVLRAIVARSLVASGLLPTLGIHHHNKYNAFCLADDMMESYRPFVDKLVLEIVNDTKDCSVLTKEIKARLLVLPAIDVLIDGQKSPLMLATQRTTASLYDCFEGVSRKLLLPEFI